MVNKHVRKVLGVVLGVGAGVFINILFGAISSYSVDVLKGTDISDAEAMAQEAAALPVSAWLLTLLGAVLGSFLAGVIGAAISKEETVWITSIIGGGLFLFPGVYILIVTSAPLWYNIPNLISYFLFSYLGGVAIMRVDLLT